MISRFVRRKLEGKSVTETVTVAVVRCPRATLNGCIRFTGPRLTKSTDAVEDYSAPKGSNWIGAALGRFFARLRGRDVNLIPTAPTNLISDQHSRSLLLFHSKQYNAATWQNAPPAPGCECKKLKSKILPQAR
jgi:hypothetical protein